uniref:Uncharacterized protein n=1 Tax=Rhizophora mucronata TaxID=61149 RepID=A0A2P2NU78_RHIMU
MRKLFCYILGFTFFMFLNSNDTFNVERKLLHIVAL